MTDLAAFLLARIAEDEEAARAAIEPDQLHPWGDRRLARIAAEQVPGQVRGYLGGTWGEHFARHDPSRVLVECQARRRMVALAQAALDGPDGRFWPPRVHMTGMADGLVLAVQVLALPYAEHPEYRQEWAP